MPPALITVVIVIQAPQTSGAAFFDFSPTIYTMKKRFLFAALLTLAAASMQAQVANTTAPADTTRGFALVLTDVPNDPAALPSLQLARVYTLNALVNVSSTPGSPLKATGTATQRLYFRPDGTQIPNDDILIFKKRPWTK